MYTSLFDTFFSDSLIAPTRTVYVVSDSQLEELKRNQRQEELDNIEDSREKTRRELLLKNFMNVKTR